MATLDKEGIRDAYDKVRNDASSEMWMVCKYDGNHIYVAATGEEYDELLEQLTATERAFIYARVIMGDELSKRAKFVFITWIGDEVGGIKKARASTDKSVVKSVIHNFAVEILADVQEDVKLANVKRRLLEAGGANYGTGVRD